MGKHIIDSIFIDRNLTADKYLSIITQEVLANLYSKAMHSSLPNVNV